MRLLFAKIYVAITFSFLLVHNVVPHHHHDKDGNEIGQHGEPHNQENCPLATHNIDHIYVVKSIGPAMELLAPAAILAADCLVDVRWANAVDVPSAVFPKAQKNLPPDFFKLNANTFRGPPVG